ncbi:MAG: hypothetical protein HRU19_33160 [Pseudobacteriovorax sp.]|nr:hypothetical protein [Pseudobacteriovorax sp.]
MRSIFVFLTFAFFQPLMARDIEANHCEIHLSQVPPPKGGGFQSAITLR